MRESAVLFRFSWLGFVADEANDETKSFFPASRTNEAIWTLCGEAILRWRRRRLPRCATPSLYRRGSFDGVVAAAMKKGEARLRRVAMHLDPDPVVLSTVGVVGGLVADHVLIVNLAGHGCGRVGYAAPVVDGEGATAGEIRTFV